MVNIGYYVMYCKNCGKELDDKAAICPHCGVPLGGYSSTQPRKTNSYAEVGFILSLFCFPAFIALICSILGYKNAEKYEDIGKEISLIGIIISGGWIALFLIFIVLAFVL